MKKALIVIDMQNDFVSGALANPEAVKIVDTIRDKVMQAQKDEGTVVLWTKDTHGIDYMDTQEGANLPVPHCVKATDGWRIVPELEPLVEPDKVFCKPTFASTGLAKAIGGFLDDDGEIELCGVCTDICVISNALLLKGFYPEMPIRIDASACAGLTPDKHEHALDVMESCQIQVNR